MSAPLKIAMVAIDASPVAGVDADEPSEQGRQVRALSEALGDRGHQVIVYTRRTHRPPRLGYRWHPGYASSTSRPEHLLRSPLPSWCS